MKLVDGWWLPDSDTYFAPFAKDGFQVDHLHAAFLYVTDSRVSVDVGAHVGFWAKEMAAMFECVHAFEPAPDTFECLAENLQAARHVRLYQCAVGEACGRCAIGDDPARPGNTGARFVRGVGEVDMVSIDELRLPACGLLKIDVEGYEAQVLSGARMTIERYRPVIVMETDKKFAKSRYDVADNAAELLLTSLGYKVVAHMRPDKVFAFDA